MVQRSGQTPAHSALLFGPGGGRTAAPVPGRAGHVAGTDLHRLRRGGQCSLRPGGSRARQAAATLRPSLGLPARYFLCTCRFIAEKNLHRLLVAYAAYRAIAWQDPWHLVLVGDGPLQSDLARWRRALGLSDTVHVVGFQQYERLPAYYGLAEALVLPSVSETWGLVVNEAMAAGLPVLVSHRCGCARDLVWEGRNGFCFDPYDTGEIRDALLRLCCGTWDRQAMGQYSRDLIGRWSVQSFADGLWSAARLA